jgi:hypothetical protein
MQSLASFFTNQCITDITKEEYEHIIMRRKLKEYKNTMKK